MAIIPDNSKVVSSDPQAKKETEAKDPTKEDGLAEFSYNPENNFKVNGYNTGIQNTIATGIDIIPFSANNKTYAPTSSPFILQLNGTGFSASNSSNPFNIYIKVGDYIAIIPQLPAYANVLTGKAFGYVVQSDISILIYFKSILFQKIWIGPIAVENFTGRDQIDKIQLQSGKTVYPFLSSEQLTLTVYVAPNNKTIVFKNSFLGQEPIKAIDVQLTQSPFIITESAVKNKKVITPRLIKTDDTIKREITLFGHYLQSKKVLFVKTSSKLLDINTSALPKEVLTADQSSQTIKNMKAQKISILEYFKVGNFLDDLIVGEFSQLNNYNYFSSDNTIKSSGEDGHLPEKLPAIKLVINTLPTGTYYIVVYDENTGAYSRAPDIITYNANVGGLQIHDVSPLTTILQAPTFTINGFNFPTTDDINNGATLSVILTSDTTTFGPIEPLTSTSILMIDKTSPSTDINKNGSLDLSADKIIARFSNLNFSINPAISNIVYIQIQVTYPAQNSRAGQINETQISQGIKIQSQPVIEFLTNSSDYSNTGKELTRIDQNTGQVIIDRTITNELFIVGKNFGDGSNLLVFIKGNKQVSTVIPWELDKSLVAIKVDVDYKNIKGDATVEVRVGDVSSEPFVFIPLSTTLGVPKIKVNAKNVVADGRQTLSNINFNSVLPYDHTDGYSLLNKESTKVSSSVKIELRNNISKQSVSLDGKLDSESSKEIKFIPNEVIVPNNTILNNDGTLNIIFNFYNIYNINLSKPKIVRLLHKGNVDEESNVFNPNEIMTVVGNGFVNGMRYDINKIGWKPVSALFPFTIDTQVYQAFEVTVPPSNGTLKTSIKITSEKSETVASTAAAGQQNGQYEVSTITVNDRYSPLLKINQRLPGGIKMYAKGPQITMTDKIDANMSIYTQITPFLAGFKIILIVVRIIVCIIDVICALINPFQLIVAIIALMDCIIDLLSLFPQLAVPIMILSFLQNFIGFLLTFIEQIKAYVFSIVNSQLALVRTKLSKAFAELAAAEQQAFSAIKQIKDVIAFLEPAMQVIQIFMDLIKFAMHFPCASNQGKKQEDGECPPGNIKKLIKEMIEDKVTPSTTYNINIGGLIRKGGVVTATTISTNTFVIGNKISISPGEEDFPGGTKDIQSIINNTQFTYFETGDEVSNMIEQEVGVLINSNQQDTLAVMFCQAVALQTATLQTMPGFNGLDGFGNPLPSGPLSPGSTSIIPAITPTLPNIAAAIECMNNLTDKIEAALNNGETFITTEEQGEALVNSYTDCVQNLIDQTNQSLGDVCVLAVSALNSELKVTPKGSVAPDISDDFVKAKIGFPTTQPNDQQDAGLVIDLATITGPNNIPEKITINPSTSGADSASNFGLKQDIYTPIIVQTTNKSGRRDSIDTIYFNADNSDVGGLIVPGDILEIVGGIFNGLQFPIMSIQQIFTAVRLTCKLDITFEQKLIVGERMIPRDLSGFDVKVIAHLGGSDAVAVVVADNQSVATVQIMARDHHGHLLGNRLADKVAIKLESGSADFVSVTPSATTDITGVIQEEGEYYIANLKSNCSGTVIVSASICGVEFQDIGYRANDPNHAITTKKKTVRIIFTPQIPGPKPGGFDVIGKEQVSGTHFPN